MTDSRALLIKAIISFENKAHELIKLMSEELELDLNAKYPFNKLLARTNNVWKGNLSGHWTYLFHGSGCTFVNELNKQLLYVKVIPAGHYREIDCFYLFEFIKSTAELAFVRTKIHSLETLWTLMLELEKDKIVMNTQPFPFKSFVLNHKAFPGDILNEHL